VRDGERLMTMRPDGTGLREVLSGAIVEDPAWAPGGRWIALRYGTEPFGLGDGVWIVRPDGSDLRRVSGGRAPSWAPDGKRLVVETNVNDVAGTALLAIVSRDGGGRQPLVPGLEPAWSPVGGRIAFVVRSPEVDDIWLLRLRDGALRNVTNNPVQPVPLEQASDPDWSPDGIRLAFGHDDGPVAPCFRPRFHIHTIRADGAGERTIEANLPTSNIAIDPVWAPAGGGRIAFLSFLERDTSQGCSFVFNREVATVTPAGTVANLTQTIEEVEDAMPSWRAVPR
jgi:Tol biopolymer transport system component